MTELEGFIGKAVQGHALTVMRKLPARSVQACVTSVPYWGLRSYGTKSQIWGGNYHCKHEWTAFTRKGQTGGTKSSKVKIKGHDNFQIVPDSKQAVCEKCGAWRGEYGAEPHPQLYIENTVRIFQEVKRVLKNDGIAWIVISDNYIGSGRAGNNPEYHKKHTMFGKLGWNPERFGQTMSVPVGLKPKDLAGIPWRCAMALQADGWWWRSSVIWHKPNAMPNPVKDRPVGCYEVILMMTKGKKYYYDYAAVEETAIDGSRRSRRDVWSVATAMSKTDHIAVFPEKLIEPCIMASTKPGDVVLDPFGGVGTTGIVAQRLGRNCVLIELNKKYCEKANVRLTGNGAQQQFRFEEPIEHRVVTEKELPLGGLTELISSE